MTKKKFQLGLKRAIDIVLSIIGLLILAVPFLIISIAIKLDSKGPVFFRQERVGKDGESFMPWKFRTMVENAEEKGLGYNVAEHDFRITRVGGFLREWGLDELPQLINVLKGEMSIVGPRPTLEYQVKQYDDFQRRRLEVKPGITGWALIHGRNKLSWEERIELDVWYVKNWSIWLDLKIMVKTLWIVLVTKEGVYGEGGVNDGFVEHQSKFPKGNNGEE